MAFDSMRQVDAEAAGRLDLRPCATVAWSRARMEAAWPLLFERDEDDFDRYEAAVIRLEPAGYDATPAPWMAGAGFSDADRGAAPMVFMLHRYAHEPANQLTIFLPYRLMRGDRAGAIGRVRDALDLPVPIWVEAVTV